jgi:four helix bundle suffix protein
MSQQFIPKHGGYNKLQSYQKAEIIYDATIYFTNRFLSKGNRTIDQMVQAARSGKQNIAEASMASATSKETEIKLTNVARASLEELLIDYRDFLRTHSLEEWHKEHLYTIRLRDLLKQKNASYETFQKGIEHPDPAICINVIIGLIKVATYLLYKQIRHLEEEFLKQGGLRERMTQARLSVRNNNYSKTKKAQGSKRQ